MLKQARQAIISNLWQAYHASTSQIQVIEAALKQRHVEKLMLDHLAIIDLPGTNTGISVLKTIFSAIGYTRHGAGYLPDKQNDFTWMAEIDSHQHLAKDVLPQVVVADFRLEEMPADIRAIVLKYSQQSAHAPLREIELLAKFTEEGDDVAEQSLVKLVTDYFTGRDWPLPTVAEFRKVQAFNELLAWVLVFGRRPNHFTLSVHLLNHFQNLDEFHSFIERDVALPLNHEGGTMKGNKSAGISQGSTAGTAQQVLLADGTAELPTGFVEFVWRYPQDASCKQPEKWSDYFTGFVAQHANHVIESLYGEKDSFVIATN